MNEMIRKVSVVVALMFAALMINVSYNVLVRGPGLLEDNRNRRVRDAEFSQNRGAILVGNSPIATTTTSNSGPFRYKRSYPEGQLYAHVSGFYSYDFGRSGLENSYNSHLSGSDSSQAFQRFLDTLSGRKPSGANVLTTIDARAQKAASEALGNRSGAVIAMDYQTGRILALVSTPSFDPNLLASTDIAKEQRSWSQLINDPAGPLLNRATTQIFLPGSTFKLITAATAIESGLTSSALIAAPDKLPLPGTSHVLRNAGSCGGKQVSIHEALVTSCNTAFGKLGMTLGADALRAQAEKFGFNKKVAADFPVAMSKFPATLDEPQTAMSAIGLYEVQASPLQMLLVTSAIANGGVMMEPHLMKNVTAQDLTILERETARELGRPISLTTANALKDAMRDVVVRGTGRGGASKVVDIFGKTGTAMQDASRPNYAWMVAFAEQPRIAVVAMIADADSDRSDIAGGRLAGPIVRQVIESVR